MARYGHDFYGRQGGWEAGYRDRFPGGRRRGYGADYGPGAGRAEYGMPFDAPGSGWGPRYSGWGRSGAEYGGGDAEYGWSGEPPGAWEREPQSDVDVIRVAEIMTRNPEAVTPDTTLQEVARRMRDLDVGIIPVVEDLDSLRLMGVITDRDIAVRAAAEAKDMKKARVEDFMSARVETVGERDHVRDVFNVMKRERVRRVPVTDDEGHLVGIVAQADLAVTYAGLDLQRETEVEEVIERISEPARPRSAGSQSAGGPRRFTRAPRSYDDRDFGDRLRAGWRTLRREARHMVGRGYDRGWR